METFNNFYPFYNCMGDRTGRNTGHDATVPLICLVESEYKSDFDFSCPMLDPFLMHVLAKSVLLYSCRG